MKFKEITATDFLTYSYLKYNFEEKPILILGKNQTDDDQESNGSGKSGFLSIIEYCLMGTTSRGVKDKELVTYGKKASKVSLIMSCDVRKENIKINWTINLSSSNTLMLSKKLYSESEYIKIDTPTVDSGKKFVTKWIAISKDDLKNYFLISNTNFKSFFKSSNKEKVELINRFSDASLIDGIEQIDDTKEQAVLVDSMRKVNENDGAIEYIGNQIKEALNVDFAKELSDKEIDINTNIKNIVLKNSKHLNTISEMVADIKDKESKTKIVEKERLLKDDKQIELDNSIADLKIDLVTENNNLDFVKRDLDAFDIDYISEEIVKCENLMSSCNSRVDEIEINKRKKNKELLKLEQVEKGLIVAISGAIDCPSCEHTFTLDDDLEQLNIDLEKVKSKIVVIVKNIENLDETILNNNDKKERHKENLKHFHDVKLKYDKIIAQRTRQYEIISRLNTKINKHESSKLDVEKRFNKIVAKFESLKLEMVKIKEIDIVKVTDLIKINNDQIEQYASDIDDLKEGNNKTHLTELSASKRALNGKKERLNEVLLKASKEVEELAIWKKNMQGFKMFIANLSLENIEYHCNRQLENIGSNLRLKMSGFKVLANGSYKEELTVQIERDGLLRSYGSFSGGEKGRLLFASILANRYMINQSHPYGGLDFLCIDEIFEGIESKGIHSLLKSIKDLNTTVYIISHAVIDKDNNNCLIIEKIGGVSNIIEVTNSNNINLKNDD